MTRRDCNDLIGRCLSLYNYPSFRSGHRSEATAAMKIVLTVSSAALVAVCLALTLSLAEADTKFPTVNIYTQTPEEPGQKNVLICHASGFHPPLIQMTLKKNGVDIGDCKESDLSFGRDWTYYKTKHADITPQNGDIWECEVKHNEGKPQIFRLETF